MNKRNPRWVWLDHVHDYTCVGLLNNHASHVAYVLAVHYTTNRNQEAWPTQQTLATAAGISKSTARRALNDLEWHGFLERRKGSPAAKFGNVYKIVNPVPLNTLNPARRGPRDHVWRERESVTANALTPSHFYVSRSSSDGDQAFNCSSGPRDHVKGAQ